MSTTTPATVCRNCGMPDLGTRFCESCGAPMIRDAPTSVAEVAADSSISSRRYALPVVMIAVSVILSAVFSFINTAIAVFGPYGSANGANLATEVVFVLLDVLAVSAIVVAGRRSGASVGARVGAILIALVAPGLDVAYLFSLIGSTYYSYSLAGEVIYLLTPILLPLAWLMSSRSPSPSYRVLWVGASATVLAYLLNAVPLGNNVLFLLGQMTADVVLAIGVILAITRAPKFAVRRRLRSTAAMPLYGANSYGAADSAIPRPMTTNGFAVSALIFGLVGGTVLPIVFGHVAHAQIRRTGERGWGMATAGLVLGYLSTTVVVVIVIVLLVLAAQAPRY